MGKVRNAHFDGAVLELLRDLVAEIPVNVDLHRRVTPAVFRKHLRQNVEAGSLVGADAKRAARRAAMVRHRHQRFLAQQFQPLGIVIEHLSGGGQLYGLAGAVEQAIAILLLQLADLGADRRLGAENFLSSAGKAALPGHFQKRD